MSKLVFRIILLAFVSTVPFSLLLFPTAGSSLNYATGLSRTSTSVDSISSAKVYPLISSQLTFTPVATIYLPIVLNPFGGGLDIVIELPNGTHYQVGEEIETIITVSSTAGVDVFTWSVFFAQNLTPITGGQIDCNGLLECKITESFSLQGPGQFLLVVDALDVTGKTKSSSVEFSVE